MPAVARSPLACLVAIVMCSAPHLLAAQEFTFTPQVQAELRSDMLSGPPVALQVGAGLNIPAGYYVRLGLMAAGGVAWRTGAMAGSARVDLTTRYLLDPFGELRWGFYGGAGVSTRIDESRARAFLLVIGGVEGPASHGWRTSIEAGLGGGARLGIVLRRARKNGR